MMAAYLHSSRLLASVLAGCLYLSACGSSEPEPAAPEAEAPAPAAEPAPAGAVPPPAEDDALKVYVLDCGQIDIADMGAFTGNESLSGVSEVYSNPCFLVRHPQGDLLWDLGLPGILASQGELSQGAFSVSLDKTLTQQLMTLGLEPSDIEYISLSHSHFDHTGQADQFPRATWIVHEAELGYMFPAESEGGGEAQFTQYEGLTRVTFTGEFDVFGDGSVQIVEAPGHTPGHSVLVVNLPESGPYIFTGDLWHSAEGRAADTLPSFSWDLIDPPEGVEPGSISRASISAINALAEEIGATVIVQHEMDDVDPLPKSPQAIR